MTIPSKKEFLNKLDSTENRLVQIAIPLNTTLTPLQAYTLLKANSSSNYSYLLESVEKEQRHARFSFVGTDPLAVITVKNQKLSIEFLDKTSWMEVVKREVEKVCEDIICSNNNLEGRIIKGCDVFDALRAAIITGSPLRIPDIDFGRQVFTGGAIGFLAYDSVYDSHLDLQPFPSEIPEAQFVLSTKTLLFDHLTEKTYLIFTKHLQEETPEGIYDSITADVIKTEELLSTAPENLDPPTKELKGRIVSCTAEKPRFEQMVRRAKQHILDGDILQVVLSRRYEIETPKTAYELYQKLRSVNPSPYMYLFEFDSTAIIGASPETLLSVRQDKVITNPIAGTCPRGATPEEDETFAQRMLLDEKERAEHVMLVDLGRNDVRAVCQGGSVVVEDFMSVLKYSHVQHIESTVTGRLREECDAFDATRAIFPAGTLSGAPKIRAMEIIHELEGNPRGVYGGGVGYYCFNGDADFAIVIRTMIKKGDRVYVQAGAGIVADSNPEYEYHETERKMAAMMRVILGSENP
jgi:anthranilate synthase component 1